MTAMDLPLGACPGCHSAIHRNRLVVRYEGVDTLVLLAECPACGEIVYPE